MRPKATLPLLLSSLVLAAACGGSDDDTGSGPSSAFTLDGLVKDAPVDDLSSFTLEISEVRLLASGGAVTDNLLRAATTVELLGLQTSSEWLFRAAPAVGTYTGARFVFDPNSVVARNLTGDVVSVNTTSSTIDSPFAAPLTVGATGYARLVLDVDLSDSLSGNVGAPPITFTPVIDSTFPGSGGFGIDEVNGTVTSISPGSSSFQMTAYLDENFTVSIGTVGVDVPGTAVLLDDDDVPFADTAAFFNALSSGSVVEVHGPLGADARIRAERIELEDGPGGGGSSQNRVEIEGRVVALQSTTGFSLLITEIEDGSEIAGPVLANLGNPSIIDVTYDGQTIFRDDETHALSSSSNLAVGQRVEVRFPAFQTSFRASVVEFEEDASHTGTITDISGLPNSFVMRMSSSEAAVQSGLVASSSTDVTVSIGGAALVLRADDDFTITASDIVTGLRVNVRGLVAGTPSAPTVDATRIRIRAGEFEGLVSGVSPSTSSFDATVITVEDPLGGQALTPPFQVVIEPGCTFEGDASSEAAFFALFSSLQPGEVLEVEVEGIGSGTPSQVRAYAIDVDVD